MENTKLLLIILYIATIATMAIVILRTNSSSKALAYLLLITTLPVVGIIIYFTIGLNYRKQKLYKKKLAFVNMSFSDVEAELKTYHEQNIVGEESRLRNFSKLAENNRFDFLISRGNTSELLINGEEKFAKLMEDLKNAKHHIHIEYYIYNDDDIGRAIGQILMDKARQGIEVRFSYDDFGSKSMGKKFIKELIAAGVEAVPFYKIRWLLFANGINYRNHRKIVVIDGKIGYVGGINVSDKYINNGKKKLYWRDTHVRFESGFAVSSLQYIFLIDWNFCAKQDIEYSNLYFPPQKMVHSGKDHLVQVVSSGPDSDYPNILYAMVQAIMLSKKQVLLTTPYFIPNSSLIEALKIASLSGIDVQILVPGISDSAFVNAISSSYYEELLEAGVRIFQYQKGFVHAKTMICDNFISFVGTANCDQRSFELNFEIHSIIYDEDFSKEHSSYFFEDIANAKEIIETEWRKRSKLKYFMERTARLISPLV